MGDPHAERELDQELHNVIGSAGSHGAPELSAWAHEVRAALWITDPTQPEARADLVLSSLPSFEGRAEIAQRRPLLRSEERQGEELRVRLHPHTSSAPPASGKTHLARREVRGGRAPRPRDRRVTRKNSQFTLSPADRLRTILAVARREPVATGGSRR